MGGRCCVHGVKGKVEHMSADKYEKRAPLEKSEWNLGKYVEILQTQNQVVLYRKQHVKIKGPYSRHMRPAVFINKLSILIISLNICMRNLGVKILRIILCNGKFLCLVCYKLIIFGCQICPSQRSSRWSEDPTFARGPRTRGSDIRNPHRSMLCRKK